MGGLLKGKILNIGGFFYLSFTSTGILDLNLLLLGSDHLNGLHEFVRYNSDADKQVDHKGSVEETTAKSVTHAHVVGTGPQGNNQTILAVDTGRVS